MDKYTFCVPEQADLSLLNQNIIQSLLICELKQLFLNGYV
jgi:hypothetical protein